MPIGAILGVGSALIGAGASRSASRTQARSAQQGMDAQLLAQQRAEKFQIENADLAINSLRAGQGQQIGASNAGYNAARGDINRGYAAQNRYINQGRDQGLSQINAGLTQSNNALRTGYDTSRADIQRGTGDAINTTNQGRDYAIGQNDRAFGEQQGYYDPMIQRGDRAGQVYDYNLGIGDQPEGYGGYENSAYQNYIMDQSQNALEGSAAARGGLFSGATIKAAQENAQGLSGQFYNNYLDRIGGVSDIGTAARGALAQFAGVRGANNANASTGAATRVAGMQQQQGSELAGQATAYGNNIAGNFTSAANNRANLYGSAANMLGQSGLNQNMALAGNNISQQNALSNIYGNTATNMANIRTGQGSAMASLALAGGDARQSGYAAIGNAQSAGTMGMANAIQGGIGNVLGAYQYQQYAGGGGGGGGGGYAPYGAAPSYSQPMTATGGYNYGSGGGIY